MDLLTLAQMAAARRHGVSLADICEKFGVSHRTAQRMTHALEASFANVSSDDGSLIVRFHAAGWLEMAWFLYQWGDKVEVLAPEGLRDYVHPWQRPDLDGMP